MDIRDWVVSCLFLVLSILSFGAGEHWTIGGRAAALGGTSLTASDEWSVFNNQAGLAWCRDFSAGLYYENRYLLKELSLDAIEVTIPEGKGAFGISFRYFGCSLYSEMNTGVAYGMRLMKRFSVGIQVDYFRLHIADGFKDINGISCEMGLQFRASDHLWLGFHVANPVPEKLSSLTTDRIPTLMRFGLSWHIIEGLQSNIEVEKDLINKPGLNAGIEYRPSKSLIVRLGFLTNPETFTFGFGINFGNIQFDLASSYHMVLGYSPQASVLYNFGKKKATQ